MQTVAIVAIFVAVVGVVILVTVLAWRGGGTRGGGDAPQPVVKNDSSDDSSVYGWNGLLHAVQKSETRVVFTYSFVRANVVVSDLNYANAGPVSTSTVTTDTFALPGSCAIDVEVETSRAMTWWAQCMQNALGVEVVFRSLGLENHNPLTAPASVEHCLHDTYHIHDSYIKLVLVSDHSAPESTT